MKQLISIGCFLFIYFLVEKNINYIKGQKNGTVPISITVTHIIAGMQYLLKHVFHFLNYDDCMHTNFNREYIAKLIKNNGHVTELAIKTSSKSRNLG